MKKGNSTKNFFERKKKIFSTMLILSVFLLIPTFSNAQKITLNLPSGSLKDVFEAIEKQGNYELLYKSDEIDVNQKVSVIVKNSDVELLLSTVLKNSDIEYKLVKKQIILKKKLPKPIESEIPKKLKQVSGIIKDENGLALPGVSIIDKTNKTGTISDADGKFSIDATVESTLQFSFIGYTNTSVKVDETVNVLNIVLKEESENLDEVVVIGYGSVKKRDLTTAVASVSTKDINERPVTAVAQAIQGKAAGIQVIQPSGKPGSAMSIRVRGSSSVMASNEPLYVVDGIPTDDISNLAPNDIESMQVLKDASSAAIYGARASNGVVLLTTKRGKTGDATFDFNTYLGFSKIGNTIDVLNSEQFIDLLKDVDKNAGTSFYKSNYLQYKYKDKNYNTNWADEVYKTGSIQNYQLSIGGGTEKYKYFSSFGYQSEKGIIQPSSFERYSGRLNVDNSVRKWLTITSNVSLNRNVTKNTSDNESSSRGGVVMSVINTPPIMPIWDPDTTTHYAQNPFKNTAESPFAYIDRQEKTIDTRLQANTSLDFSIINNLKFKANLGADYTSSDWSYYLDNVKTVSGRASDLNGEADNRKTNTLLTLYEGILTYNKSIQNKHNLSAMVGFSNQNYRLDQTSLYAYNFPKDYSGNGSITGANVIKQSSNTDATEWATLSYLGRITYDYMSKYYLTANFRTDGSSKLAPKHRWDYFPSLSLAWRLSSEDFMNFSKEFMNDLKVRVGWGVNGNQEGIGDYEWRGLKTYSRTGVGNVIGESTSCTPNEDLKWETTTQYNAGLDFSFFNSRIVLTVDAYLKRTKDLLMEVEFPSTCEVTKLKRNDGEMENKGLEFEIHTTNINTKDFTWNTDFNISFNRNKITKLDLSKTMYYANIETNGQNVIIVKEGASLGAFYGYISEGVDPLTGDIVYKDLDGNGTINEKDKTIIGNAQPKFIYGFNNTLSYMGFDLSFFFQGSYGNDIFNASRIDSEGMIDASNQTTEVLKRWKRPGMITDIPRAGIKANIYNSTRFVEDGSYLRLKSVTLNYNLKKEWLKPLNLNKLSVYVTGQNLLTFTKYSGYDPEVNMGGTSSTVLGVDYGTYPQSKSFVFGLNVSF